MVGLERLISWLPALISAVGLIHQAPWIQWLTASLPSKRDKINSKASQSDPGAKLVFTSSIFHSHIVIPQCCVNTGVSRPFEHQKKAQRYQNFGG
jgi:hypothetical protein